MPGDIQRPDATGALRAPRPSAGWRLGALGVLDRQVLRFMLVGVVNSVFAFGVFAGLQLTIGRRLHYLVILLIAHVITVLEAYVLQRWLVFRVSGGWWRDLARFWSVYLVAGAVNFGALPLLVEIAHVSVLPAQAFIMLGIALGTFVAHSRFTFRRPRDSTDQPGVGVIGRIPRRETAS